MSKKSASKRSKTRKNPDNTARKKTLNELNQERDWVKFNRRVARLRGKDWRHNIMLSTLSEKDSLLKIERITQGLSQKEMASKLGMPHTTTYKRIELGKSQIDEKMVLKIAKVLNLDPTQLFKKVPYKNKFETF